MNEAFNKMVSRIWQQPEIVAAGLTPQQPTGSHMAILEGIESSVLRAACTPDAAERKKIAVTHSDLFEAIYLFSRPIAECRATYFKGREVFRETAWDLVGGLPPHLIDPLGTAVLEVWVHAFQSGAPKKEGNLNVSVKPKTHRKPKS